MQLWPTEICWDSSESKFELDDYTCLNDADEKDNDYELGDETSDLSLCGPVVHDDNRYTFRKRARNT
jgi:hypothetical protein